MISESTRIRNTATTAMVTLICVFLLQGFCAASETVKVSVGIPPLAYLVERIGGDRVSVEVLLLSGQDPHTFEPTPRQIMGPTGADVYFSVGLPFEERLASKIRGSGSSLVIVDTSGHEPEIGHTSDSASTHEHEDPHIWLAPSHLAKQAAAIFDVLVSLDPEHSGTYERNFEELRTDIDRIDDRIRQLLDRYQGREFLVYHSALGYFAREYGLIEVAIEAEGKSPGAKALTAIIERAKSEGIKAVFVQPQFDDSTARVIAEAIGAAVMQIDPLERDVLSNLLSIAEQLAGAMR